MAETRRICGASTGLIRCILTTRVTVRLTKFLFTIWLMRHPETERALFVRLKKLSRQVQKERVFNAMIGGSQAIQNVHQQEGNPRLRGIVTQTCKPVTSGNSLGLQVWVTILRRRKLPSC